MSEYIEREALMRRIKEIHCAECDSYNGARMDGWRVEGEEND